MPFRSSLVILDLCRSRRRNSSVAEYLVFAREVEDADALYFAQATQSISAK
jgi:hypothetical protein